MLTHIILGSVLQTDMTTFCRAIEFAHGLRQEDKEMSTGRVKWFNTTKGFGFIEPDEGGSDAFVHITAVQEAGLKELVEGQHLEYEMMPAKNGRDCAMNLKLLEG